MRKRRVEIIRVRHDTTSERSTLARASRLLHLAPRAAAFTFDVHGLSFVIPAERREAREPGPTYPCGTFFERWGTWVPDRLAHASRPG